MIAFLPGIRRRRGVVRRAAAGTACVSLAVALTACGSPEDPDAGTNGVGKLSPTKIQQKTLAAAEGAPTVRISGKLVSGRRTYELDMQLTGNGGKGEVSTKDTEFSLLRIGKELYVKADAGFWAHQEGGTPSRTDSAAAAKLDGKYVKVPAADRTYRQFSGFTEKDALLDTLLTLHGKLARGEHSTLGGTRTIRISAAQGNGGTLDVSLEGKPYPLRLNRAGGAGTVQFADWGKRIDLAEPDRNDVVDYGESIGSGN